ncbi:MAG: YobA family protein [Bacillota bacterium]|nr:YobA family protein [Bacillota bacterium]MDW7683569.1 YobA family protein [Bacillota bacterium]
MKKLLLSILALLVVSSLVGCLESRPSGEPGITGYVMKREDGRILVIDPNPQDFSSTGGVDEYYNAIYFSNAPRDVTVGDKVKVWFDIMMDSYPGQSEVEYLEIVPSPKPAGANLNESEALNKALMSQEFKTDVVVNSIDYMDETSRWIIKLKQIWGDELYTVEVNDK